MQPLFELDMSSSLKYQKERKEYDRLLFASRKEKGNKEEKELPVEPVLKKFIVSDITPERLIPFIKTINGASVYMWTN